MKYCDLVLNNEYVSAKKKNPLYVCSRKGCRGHGFGVRGQIPQRICDHGFQSIYLGTILQILFFPAAIIFWIYGFKCNCKEQRNKINRKYGFYVPWARRKVDPWDDPMYADNLIKVQ